MRWATESSSIKGGFYTGEPITAGSYPAAVFEVANKRYPGTPEITLLLNSIDRVAADSGGFPETYFCYPTLTHGVSLPSWPGALGSDFEAAGNWNSAIPVDDAVSQVAFFDGTPQNMPQLTRHRSLAGMHLRGGNTTLSASAGQVLTLGALGIGNGAAGTATHTISAALHLAAPQSWNAPSGKTLTVSGNITGTSGLTKSGLGSLTLSGANTYTGETNIREGLVSISNAAALGASGSGNRTIVHPGARVELSSASPGYAEAFTIHNTSGLGAMRFANSNILVSGNITLADHSRMTGRFNRMTGAIGLGAYTLTIAKNSGDVETWSAVISGTGGLTMAGGNSTTKLTLTGANSYTGDTTVTSGILTVNGSSIANSNKIIINGGKVEATGTEVVGSLVFGTVPQPAGTYGSSTSPATYKDDTRFAGSGVIHVIPPDFDSWIAGYNLAANARGSLDDPDYDGFENILEYALGGHPGINDAAAIAPVATRSGTDYVFTYQRSAHAKARTVQTVEYSSDLAIWGSHLMGQAPGSPPVAIQENVPAPGMDSVTVTLPTGGEPSFFVRLKVYE